jgi:F-type H+-transporting ATPase subunit c
MSISKKLAPTVAFGATFLLPLLAFAQDGASSNAFDIKSWAAIGAAVAIGLGVLGGALGQGRAAAAALEGIARNPGASARIQTPMILGLALIESLVLLAFVIAFFLYGVANK